MSDTGSNELVQAAASIVASYVGNPNVNLPRNDLPGLFTEMHGVVSRAAGAAVVVPSVAPRSSETTPAMSETARASLGNSSVQAGSGFDPAKVWPNASDAQRERFEELIAEHNLQRDANGVPVSRKPIDKLVEPWQVFDPISGKGYRMLKRHLSVHYNMDIKDLIAMFHLPDDFPVTAPKYSESKAKDAARMGLGESRAKAAAARRAEKEAPPKSRRRKAG